MGRKRYTVEQIIGKLREAEIAIGKGMTVPQAARQIGVAEQTYYRWRKEYGGLRLDQPSGPRPHGKSRVGDGIRGALGRQCGGGSDEAMEGKGLRIQGIEGSRRDEGSA